MIELNLLPDELKIKKKKTLELANLPIIPTFLGILCVLIVTHLLLIFCISINKMTLAKSKKEWENFFPKRKEIDTLKEEVKNINANILLEYQTEQH